MPATVSVIIPTYNYGRFINEALDSVFRQTYPANEVIVVDDGSTDETEEVVRQYGDNVKYVKQANAGVCRARNKGVEVSSGEFIAFLDADDLWLPTKLEKQLSVFMSDPLIGLVHCGLTEFDSATGKDIRQINIGGAGWIANQLLLWTGPAVNGPGSTVVVKREVFYQSGGFDFRMKVGEDWDFCYRIARKHKVGFSPELLVCYRIHDDGAHRDVKNMELGMGLFYEKAFEEGDEDVLRLRNRSMSNYHRILSGSYLYAGLYGQSMRHAMLSILKWPPAVGYFLKTPYRFLSRSK